MASKLWPHLIKTTSAGLNWARRASGVVALDNVEALQVAPPNAVRVLRHYFEHQDLGADPRWVADQILGALKGYRHPLLYCQVYVGIAGPSIGTYIPLLRAVVGHLHAAGVNSAGPSWYTGDYEPEHVQAMRNASWCDLDLWCLQAYWATMGLTKWNALRYREMWRPGDPRIVIGECGRDRVRDGDPAVDEGWVGTPGWKSQGVSAEEYVRELAAFDRELQRAPYILGAAVFTAGPTDDWSDFDTDELDTTSFNLGAPVVVPPVEPPSDTGGQEMSTLAEQFPQEFERWQTAGGVDNNFRSHLIGIGALPQTRDALVHLLNEEQAKLNQIRGVVERIPFPQ